MKANRNDPCPCGSGKKYKRCCAGKTPWYKEPFWAGLLIILVFLVAALFAWSEMSHSGSATDGQGRVWSPDHGHYH